MAGKKLAAFLLQVSSVNLGTCFPIFFLEINSIIVTLFLHTCSWYHFSVVVLPLYSLISAIFLLFSPGAHPLIAMYPSVIFFTVFFSSLLFFIYSSMYFHSPTTLRAGTLCILFSLISVTGTKIDLFH